MPGKLKDDLIIGVDVGGTRTKVGLIDLSTGKVLHVVVQGTETNHAGHFIEGLGKVIDPLKAGVEAKGHVIRGIGVGVPGFTTAEGVVVTTYGSLKFMEAFPLQKLLQDRIGVPCCIDNDARTIALGEAFFGKGKGYNRVMVLTLGTGVGFGFVVNGRFSDAMPFAHMAGNMAIVSEGGECYCGKKGCLEALVSATGILNLAHKAGLSNLIYCEDVFDLAEKSNKEAAGVIEKVIQYLHIAIHNYVNLFAPDVIVLGGGIAKSLSPYLERIKGVSYLGPYPNYDFVLTTSQLEEQAGILGSASLFNSLHNKVYEVKG